MLIFILFASKRKMERGPDDAAAAYTTHAESEFGKRGRDMKGNNEWGATKWGAARCGAKRPKTSSGRGTWSSIPVFKFVSVLSSLITVLCLVWIGSSIHWI